MENKNLQVVMSPINRQSYSFFTVSLPVYVGVLGKQSYNLGIIVARVTPPPAEAWHHSLSHSVTESVFAKRLNTLNFPFLYLIFSMSFKAYGYR